MKRRTQFALCATWISLIFLWLNQKPPAAPPFPQQGDNLIPPRSIYNLELADGVNQGMRDFWQKPDKVLDTLGNLEGSSIADIGAGQGYFTLRLLRRVGPEGVVYANDIQENVLDRLRQKVPQEYGDRIRFVLGDEHQTGIEEPVDWIFLIQVLAEVDHQRDFLRSLKGIMQPETRLVVIDSKHITDSETGFTRPLNLKRLQNAFAEEGLEFAPEFAFEDLQFLPKQFFFVLKKNDSNAPAQAI